MLRALLLTLAQELLRLVLRRATRQALPQILSQVDAELPYILGAKPTPESVETVFRKAIVNATNERALPSEVRAIIGLYDPIRNALRVTQR